MDKRKVHKRKNRCSDDNVIEVDSSESSSDEESTGSSSSSSSSLPMNHLSHKEIKVSF